jgi:hypothetical protein
MLATTLLRSARHRAEGEQGGQDEPVAGHGTSVTDRSAYR